MVLQHRLADTHMPLHTHPWVSIPANLDFSKNIPKE